MDRAAGPWRSAPAAGCGGVAWLGWTLLLLQVGPLSTARPGEHQQAVDGGALEHPRRGGDEARRVAAVAPPVRVLSAVLQQVGVPDEQVQHLGIASVPTGPASPTQQKQQQQSQAVVPTLSFALTQRQVVEFSKAFAQSFTLMCAAEIFDRTWFVTMICAVYHGSLLAFLGSFSALSLHSVLAVTFGESVAYMLPKWSLSLISASVLIAMTIVYAMDFSQDEPGTDALGARREEAKAEVDAAANPQAEGGARSEAEAASSQRAASGGEVASGKLAATAPGPPVGPWATVASIFVTIFVAEWGDRTQIVQISLATSLPALPVILGAISGLFLLCLSAVSLARMLDGRQLDPRLLNGLCIVSFGIMGAISLKRARDEYLESQHVLLL